MLQRCAAFAATALLCAPALAGTYVFGDSSVEQGNLYALPGLSRPGTPYFVRDGFSRESNGPVWIERLVPGIRPVLGAGLTARDVNFAYSGATSGRDNIAAPVETGLAAQVDAFAARIGQGASKPAAGDLFVIAAGTNDFIRDLGTVDLRTTSQQVIGNLTGAVSRLSGLGAARVLVEDIPNFILAPEFKDIVPAADRGQLVSIMTNLVRDHNATQVQALSALNTKLAGTNVVTVPISKLFDHVRAHAAELGFGEIDKGCYDPTSGALCSTDAKVQNGYLFFDNLHLSARGQQIQADYYRALLDQLDGSANRVPAAIGRDTAILARAEAARERDTRHGVWAAEPAARGVSLIGDASRSHVDEDEVVATRGQSSVYRMGIGYSDGDGWTVRFTGSRQQGRFHYALGDHHIDGWAVTAAGERRWGDLRLGASVSQFWGEARGTRHMPVALMSASYRSKLSASQAELEAGGVLTHGTARLLPSAWLRYEQARLAAYQEEGQTGLEMRFGSHRFEALYGGIGTTAAIELGPIVTARATLSHERWLTSGGGTLSGLLVDNSADPIALRVRPFETSATTAEPAVAVRVGSKAELVLSSSARLDRSAYGGRARLSIRF